jgi:uncharacterized membrane-anchored protein YhcB (DUF1043 family)
MQQLKIIFDRYEDSVEERRDIKSIIKDACDESLEYKKAKEEFEEAKAKLKEVKNKIEAGFAKELEKFEELQADIKSDREIMSDVALAMYAKGEPVVVKDKYNQEYEGEFKVRFKKL